MLRLKSREKFPPGGFSFNFAPTKWHPAQFSSFDTIVRGLQAHLNGNPYVAHQNNMPTDYESLALIVEHWNAMSLKARGLSQFITDEEGGGPQAPPKSIPQPLPTILQSVKRVAVGANTVAEMLGPEGPVDLETATSRAAVCVTCPMNAQGDFTRFFTVPAAGAIRGMLGFFKSLKLSTVHDAQLHVCEACYCPILLKVWARLSHITKHMPADDYAALHKGCWIRAENESHGTTPENQHGENSEPDPAPEPVNPDPSSHQTVLPSKDG